MVIKQKSNGRWEYCIYLGLDERGKKKYKRKSGFKTKMACLKEANNIAKNKNEQLVYKTFKEIGFLFLEDCQSRYLRETTIICYKNKLRFFEKNFKACNKDIKKITEQDIIEFIKYLCRVSKGYNIQVMITFMKTIFIFAQKNKYIDNNVFNNIKLPTRYKGTRSIWSKSDLDKYLPILEKYQYFDIVILVLETGLRRGEVCALTWDCVDLNRGVIIVNKSYTYLDKIPYFNQPKTKSSIREIVLLKRSIDILSKRIKKKKSKYIFYNNINPNLPINPSKITRTFRCFIAKNKLKHITFHDLRHIHATLLLNNNINYKILSKRLGHSNVAFTLQTYTHISSDYEIDLFKNMNNIF